MKKGLLLLLVISFFILPNLVFAKTSKNTVNIYFFHSNTCPHCKSEEEVLKILDDKYENVSIYSYEVHDETNKIILDEVKKVLGISSDSVPITIIGNQYYIGFSDKSPVKFIKTIEYFSKYTYDDKVMRIINPNYESNYHESPYIKRENFKKFVNEYRNYDLIGLKTDDLHPNTIAIIIGVISILTLATILSTVLVFALLTRVGGASNKVSVLMLFFSLLLIFKIDIVFKNNIYHLIVSVILYLLFTINLIKYYKNKKQFYLILNFVIIIAILAEYLNSLRCHKYIFILKDIAKLHLLGGIDYIGYYANFITCVAIMFLLIIIIIYLFFQKRLRR